MATGFFDDDSKDAAEGFNAQAWAASAHSRQRYDSNMEVAEIDALLDSVAGADRLAQRENDARSYERIRDRAKDYYQAML